MNPLSPVSALPLFPDERAALLDVLSSLSDEDWSRGTPCPGWSVKDIAAHILADDLGRLSGGRDQYRGQRFEPLSDAAFEEDLLAFINAQNEAWVTGARRLSPRVILELLEWSGRETQSHFESLDLNATASIAVSWAGETQSANWFDLARELSERWLHQAQIRETAGAPLLYDPRIFVPVLDTFVRALAHTFRRTKASDGTHIRIVIIAPQPADDPWTLEYSLVQHGGWRLVQPLERYPAASVAMDGDTAWRVFTHGISREEGIARSTLEGDRAHAEKVFDTVSIIA